MTVAFRAGHPEISPRNKTFAAIAGTSRFTADDPATRIHPAVAPAPGDVVVRKLRVSAFAGSDLDVVLRAGGIDRLVLTGIATSGVVLSTLRQAADLDYGLTVLADGRSCASNSFSFRPNAFCRASVCATPWALSRRYWRNCSWRVGS